MHRLCAVMAVIATLTLGAVRAGAADGGPGQTGVPGGGYRRVAVYCIGPKGQPLPNCSVEFKHNAQVAVPCSPSPCRCITAHTGFCEKLLRCCGHQGSPPQIQWTIKASSMYGEASTYFWSSCGWQCGESKTIRLHFKP